MSLFTWFFLWLLPATPQTLNLTLSTSVEKEGNLHIAVYDSDQGFLDDQKIFSIVRPTNGQPVSLEVKLPASGTYVLAAFHDLNGNGELDTNLFGAPSEPYGFSKEPPSKWRKPRFGEVATNVTPSSESIKIELKKWKEY